jgi:hypothetical protein
LANPRSAPFIIEYSGSVALPCMPAVEVIITSVPPRAPSGSIAACAQ